MDATPLSLGQEFSGYVSQIDHGIKALIYGLINRFGYSHIENRNTIRVKRWA